MFSSLGHFELDDIVFLHIAEASPIGSGLWLDAELASRTQLPLAHHPHPQPLLTSVVTATAFSSRRVRERGALMACG